MNKNEQKAARDLLLDTESLDQLAYTAETDNLRRMAGIYAHRGLDALDHVDAQDERIRELEKENKKQRDALNHAGHYLDRITHDQQMWQHKFREWAGLALIEVQKGLGRDPMAEWEEGNVF